MKEETIVLFSKGACYVVIGGLTPLTTGLGQWVDSGEWPPTINWVVIIAGCFVGAATQLLAFLSQSYGTWREARKSNGNGVDKAISPATP